MSVDYYRDDDDFGDLFGALPNQLSADEARWLDVFKKTRGDKAAADAATGYPFLTKQPSQRLEYEIREYREFHRTDPLERVRRIVDETADIAFVDIRELFDDAGNLLPVYKLPKHVAAAVASVDVVTSNGGAAVLKYKFHPKLTALESLAKKENLYKDNNKIEAEIKTEEVGDSSRDLARRLAFVLRNGLEQPNSQE